MEYTVNHLAKLSGVSTRTLRYYDKIGLLKPLRVNSNGYRIYGDEQINLLQQILFTGIWTSAWKTSNPSSQPRTSTVNRHWRTT